MHRQLIFSFFVARPLLAADAESGRKLQSGPDMAQNHPWGPFWRYGACETTSRQYILCRSAPNKESATRLFPVAAFCIEAGRDTDLPACSVTFTYTACRLAHPKLMVGCWDLPISRFWHVTQSQLKNSAQTYSYYINSAQIMLAVFLCALINTKTISRPNKLC